MKILVLCLCAALTLIASAADPCQQYYGKGYCTDYVNSRLRTRIRGDAENWPANTAVNEIRPGDVAIFRREGHVAWVERVIFENGRPAAIDVTEQNFGRNWVNRECRVTDNFGKVTTRKSIPLIRVDGVYREPAPKIIPLSIPGSHANSTPPRAAKPRKQN